MYALGEFEPGDEVEVVVLLGGERPVLEVVRARGGGWVAISATLALATARA